VYDWDEIPTIGRGWAMAGQEQSTRGAPSRTLVVCCDGTWNDPDDQTNVWRTFEFLRKLCDQPERDPDPVTGTLTFESEVMIDVPGGGEASVPIFAYYDKGVGELTGGGAFGVGLGENVRQAYKFVAEHWQESASIFIFGFSRGAYTARSLAGMLNAVGIVHAYDSEALDFAWAHYRKSPSARKTELSHIKKKQRPGAKPGTVVRFLGVWDTVGSLGVPVPRFRGLSNKLFGHIYRFHDTALGKNVINACQALAIHEKRGAFKPVLWTRRHETVEDEEGNEVRQRVLQVWFTGSHGDVGGGYQGDRRLADISLTWMLRRALESGHPLKESAWSPHCDPSAHGARNDSLTMGWRIVAGDRSEAANALLQRLPFFGKLGLALLEFIAVRNVQRAIGGEIVTDDGQFIVGVDERLHESVTQRYRGEHRPDAVKVALDATLPVFHERLERRPPSGKSAVMIDDVTAQLVNRSTNGVCVDGVAWLEPNGQCRVTLGEERWGGRVIWVRGDRAGIALRHPHPVKP
jgi:uncharacterized protein (DUF2235 family)